MEAQPVTPGAALFSQAQVDALRRLKDAFEQKLLDEDEYKAEKAKVLNATPAAAPPCHRSAAVTTYGSVSATPRI